MMKRLKCLDLRDNSIDVSSIGLIAEDVGKYHIYNLKFGIQDFYLLIEKHRKHVTRSTVEVTFSMTDIGENGHKIDMDGLIYFFHNGALYSIHAKLTSYAEYDYKPYDTKIQDYLYTYFVSLIENNNDICWFVNFKMPDSLASYYPTEEWDILTQKTYHWIDIENYMRVERLPQKPNIPGFFHGIKSI